MCNTNCDMELLVFVAVILMKEDKHSVPVMFKYILLINMTIYITESSPAAGLRANCYKIPLFKFKLYIIILYLIICIGCVKRG